MLSNIILLIGITLMYSTPLAFGALGGVISERSGVTNIGIEGMMGIGAIAAAATSYFTGNPWLGFLAAGVCGALIALLHAVASVSFAADQTVSGVAINMLAPGLALFACKRFFDGAAMTPIVPKLPKILGESGLAGTPFAELNVNVTTVIALLFATIMWFVLYKTKWGLRVRAVGEHPAAADTLGIDVYKVRYACVLISGMLAGLGGASVTIAIISQFTQTSISGQGFIAMAAVIFGKWTPFGAYGACLLFGFTQALAIILGGGDFVIPSQILSMLPYAMTIIVLVLFVGRSAAPKADGVPYIKGSR